LRRRYDDLLLIETKIPFFRKAAAIVNLALFSAAAGWYVLKYLSMYFIRSVKMAKEIVILNGSPRANGNTSVLIREFKKGAEESGHSVTTFLLHNMEIKGCQGCWKGGENAKSPCAIKDDMDKIYPVYQEADIVVLASPLYYWTISGQLKTAFDRLFAVAECNGARNPSKAAILLMAAEGNGYEETIFWYERLMTHIKWRNLGQVLAGGVHNPGDIEGKPELVQAYKLGQSI
jgi:multimeric flavodoxin WrbA